jgi:hypothetical protein
MVTVPRGKNEAANVFFGNCMETRQTLSIARSPCMIANTVVALVAEEFAAAIDHHGN